MDQQRPYLPASDRYTKMTYAHSGKSGAELPQISLGLWKNFGSPDSFEQARDVLRAAFDHGVTHIDLADNYGPPGGAAEETFRQVLEKDFSSFRDELFISTKAGYDMWHGPYGKKSGSRKHLMASLDQCLNRLNLDYVDLFYHHAQDTGTPVEESMQALVDIVRSGKALYVGLSNYRPERAAQAFDYLSARDTPCFIYQGRHSMFDRHNEQNGMTKLLEDKGIGYIVYSPLEQGLLSDKYLGDQIPSSARANKSHGEFSPDNLKPEVLEKIKQLNDIARSRGQKLAQMAIQWLLHQSVVTSVLIGASSPEQIAENAAAVENISFQTDELEAIEKLLKTCNFR